MRPAWAVLGAVAFGLLATLNAGGYRYGASDQAFYIPAILHHLNPSLYPRDWAMIGAQGRYFLVDEIGAALVGTTGLALPVWFAVAQVATLAALYGGALSLGRTVLTTPWALAAWLAALTLRHRIAKTGANTLEGYFHPRMLVFGLGLMAVAGLVRGRRAWPLTLLVASAALHPTTAALFLAIGLVLVVTAEPRWRAPATAVATVLLAIGGILVALGVAPIDLTPMDPTWRALVATKDYTFPTAWSAGTWLINLAGPLVLAAAAWARWRDQRLTRHELGLIAGGLLLVAGFVLSLPLIAAGVPFVVQLQTSRAFWPVEMMAMLYLVWWAIDRPLAYAPTRWPRVVAVLLIATSLVRGLYVGFIESPDRPTLAITLPDNDWTRALAWIRSHTPADALVLADPGHAWKSDMGTAVRIGAARDVVLEETKDVAMAMYSRDAAHRVATTIGQLQDFAHQSDAELRALAAATGASVLVLTRPFAAEPAFTAGNVRVYLLPR